MDTLHPTFFSLPGRLDPKLPLEASGYIPVVMTTLLYNDDTTVTHGDYARYTTFNEF